MKCFFALYLSHLQRLGLSLYVKVAGLGEDYTVKPKAYKFQR